MKNNYNKLIPLILAGFFSHAAYADSVIYKMKDKNGRTVYSDRLPANEKGTYAIMSPKSGVLKATVAKEMNKEEVQAIEEQKQEEKKIVEKNETQKKKDTALLSTYSNVAEIEKMKKFEMLQIDQSIRSSVDVIANLKDRINQMEENMRSSPNNKKLQDDTQKLLADLETANKTLEYNKDLSAKRAAKYDDDRARFEQILKEMTSAKN